MGVSSSSNNNAGSKSKKHHAQTTRVTGIMILDRIHKALENIPQQDVSKTGIDTAMVMRNELYDIVKSAAHVLVPGDLPGLSDRINVVLRKYGVMHKESYQLSKRCPISPVDNNEDMLAYMQLAISSGFATERDIAIPYGKNSERKHHFLEHVPVYMCVARIMLSPPQFAKLLYVFIRESFILYKSIAKHNKTTPKNIAATCASLQTLYSNLFVKYTNEQIV